MRTLMELLLCKSWWSAFSLNAARIPAEMVRVLRCSPPLEGARGGARHSRLFLRRCAKKTRAKGIPFERRGANSRAAKRSRGAPFTCRGHSNLRTSESGGQVSLAGNLDQVDWDASPMRDVCGACSRRKDPRVGAHFACHPRRVFLPRYLLIIR